MNARFTLFCAFLAAPAWAAPLLALPEAVSEALQNSPALQKQASAQVESEWKRTESLSGFLPSVKASATHFLDKKYQYLDISLTGSTPISFPQVFPSTTYALDATLPLFDGLANVNRYRAASEFVDASRRDFDWARFRLEREVILLYYKALGARLLQEVAERNLSNLEDHLKDVQAFKKAGVSTNYDVLRVEVQVSEARSAVLDSTDNVQVARNLLGEALGRSTQERQLTGELPVPAPSLISQAPNQPAGGRDDLAALSSRADAFGHLESAASVHLVPKLSLMGQYLWYNNRNKEILREGAFRHAYMVGVNLSWNLFDGLASLARSKESVEQRVQAEKSLEIARIHSHQELDIWRRKFLYFCSVYRSRQSDIQKARESVRLAREGRRVGVRTNTDLLDAESDFHRAEAGAVNAQLGAIEALLNLELAAGTPLHKFF